ncbi:MAG: hypothetical protein JNL34_02010 [Anaerolineae bacterium]|nr:hypothetical protein [Anaerolineae bacterium]
MKSLRGLMVVTALLLMLPFAVNAQGNTQTADLGDGYQIIVPASWVIAGEDGIFTAEEGELAVEIYTPAGIAEIIGLDLGNAKDALDAMVILSLPISQVRAVRDDLQKTPIGDRIAATIATPEIEPEMLLAAVPMSDGTFGYLQFSAPSDVMATMQDELLAVIESFDVAGEEGAAPANAGSGVACTVSASAANTSQLRVGPGENRSAIAFLPANTDVTVTGRIVLNDGSVWFQLDKAEAAPQGSAAAELWVIADAVETSGDCDQVGETNAPPVIPISVAPPPAATLAPGEAAPPPAQPGALPSPGTWTLTLDPVMNASCLGYENVSVPTADVYTSTSWSGNLSIVNNGAFNFDGDTFQRLGSSNSFAGTIRFSYTEGGTTDTQVRFDLISSSSMSGQIVDNYTYDDGTPCSDTVTFTARHN